MSCPNRLNEQGWLLLKYIYTKAKQGQFLKTKSAVSIEDTLGKGKGVGGFREYEGRCGTLGGRGMGGRREF